MGVVMIWYVVRALVAETTGPVVRVVRYGRSYDMVCS